VWQRCQDAPGQRRSERREQAGVGVGGDQLDPGKSRGRQVRKNCNQLAPSSGGDIDAQDFTVAVGVHSGRDDGVDPRDPAVPPDFEDQRVGREECVGALVQAAVPERR